MKFYDKNEASDTLSAILSAYDKRTISDVFSTLAIQSLKNDGAISFPEFNMTLIKQNGKFAIKIGNEE